MDSVANQSASVPNGGSPSETAHSFANGVQGLIGDFDIVHNLFVNPADNTQLCVPNPRRIYLAFSNVSATNGRIGPHQMPTGLTDGYPFSGAILMHEFHWTTHAILCSVAWYVNNLALGNIAVYEVIWTPKRVL